ncbi:MULTISPECIES: DAK2 domain-containing protein [unclassified Micromonospora]|uniref:DAK2 domain-containing protein n=1 Tax=unclassified Micromonospora TaxID=2617518 RepID=UPI001C24D71F|nr:MULTISPECIES: DAK2 domain-containing protein [unclassified Micromonospora]MBU8859360.1 DAK2 domain-containing protein [Micromonospora sp. WMMB482]MDM4778872.1 DAK2 domain-containing protein [Micromonospora sp. b486]
MLETLDAAAVRRWCASGLTALRAHQGEIDELNVYPVPDGDTGTNLVLTFTSAQQALAMDLGTLPDDGHTPHGHALRLMARGALLGARGNSGVILSQILRALADTLAAAPAVRGRQLADALADATTAAYAAVARPVEGTLLSVVAAAAHAARRADSDDLRAVARAAAEAAAHALARTPEQLPELARAGVVDAGGRGLCLLLDALVEVITGESPAQPAPAPPAPPAPPARRPPVTAVRESGSDAYAYEVQYLLDADDEAVARLRAELSTLGDSLAVVGDGAGTWNVHVHVNDIGAAVEAGVVAGRPHRITVTRFADQGAPAPGPQARASEGRAAVVVATGAGIAELFAAEGAVVVPANPSTGELLDAIRATGAARVVVLPNDPNTQSVASAAAREAHGLGVKVSVVPTRSPVQALAALAVRDPKRRFEDDVIAMAEAAGACRYAEVCHAAREALTVAGPARPGDVLALVEGEVHLIGQDLVDTCTAVVDRMLGGGGELVTLLCGADAPAGLADRVRTHVEGAWPFVEVQAYEGGQPHYPLLVGVE